MKKIVILLIHLIIYYGCAEESDLEDWLVNNVNLTLKVNKVDGSTADVTCYINESVIITEHGICWSRETNPTIVNSKISLGTLSDTVFNGFIENLEPAINYYVKGYIIADEVTLYSNEKKISTTDGLPVGVITKEISDTTAISATSGGEIENDNGFAIKSKGVCWSTNTTPTIIDNHTDDGEGTESFTSSLENLDVSTTYYVRAYATNVNGTSYGNEIVFKTYDGLPKGISTLDITNITPTSASSGGVILDNGGFNITARGVCWSTSQNPTINDNRSIDGTGDGEFTSTLIGLTNLTTYYVRAYATNVNGTAYGNEISFKAREILKDYDGNEYEVVKIGEQVWMAENLKTTHYADGTEIPHVENDGSWDNLSGNQKAYCYYSNAESYFEEYGALYNWSGAMNGYDDTITHPINIQGVCPDGWHMPNALEWNELFDYLGGTAIAGNKMKEVGTVHWRGNEGATNESGFTAFGGGFRRFYGVFDGLRYFGYFWSSSEGESWSSDGKRACLLYCTGEYAGLDSKHRQMGFSVRCLKD